MAKKTSKYLEANWDKLKGKIKQKWAKLTDDDILQIEGSYDELTAALEKLYGDKVDDIQRDIIAFLTKHGFDEKNLESKAQEINSMKEIIFEYMDDYFQAIKDKSAYLEDKTVTSVKAHPLKWLGAAALGGFILAKLVI